MNTDFEKYGEFEVIPCQADVIKNNNSYKKLNITNDQKDNVLILVSQLPVIADVSMKSKAYIVKFPKGLPHTLMKYKTGGVGSSVIDNNKIVGHASFHKIGAAVAVSFAVLSVATGQYYLNSIDSKLNDIKSVSQRILDFLEDDKRSELKSEVQFVNRAFMNYDQIISNDPQRISTITNLQNTEKVSFKNCEFYLETLRKTIHRDNHIEEDVRLAFNYDELLETSLKFYILSSILEAYYAQNFNTKYLENIKKDLILNINNFAKPVPKYFGHLKKRINNTYDTWYWRFQNRGEVLEKIYKLQNSYNHDKVEQLQKKH